MDNLIKTITPSWFKYILLVIMTSSSLITAKAQCFSCDSITNYNVDEVYSNLLHNSYPLIDAICFGSKMAEHDKNNDIKRVLLFYGPFTDGCLECSYYRDGFEAYSIGADDIVSDVTDAFVESYNESMLSDKKKETQIDRDQSSQIFKPWLSYESAIEVEQINNSTLSFRIQSDSLENLFKTDMKHLTVCIGDSITDPNYSCYSYNKVKSIGIDIPISGRSSFEISAFYDFKKMPNRYDICWCKALEQKYRFTIPVNFK